MSEEIKTKVNAIKQQYFGGDVETLLASGRRIAVHLVGSELSRGRGGPRCLTCPVERDA